MSFHEKKSILSILSSIIIIGIYSLYTYFKFQAGTLDTSNIFKFWASFILVLIPLSMVANMLINIIFRIINKAVTQGDDVFFMDERDKMIELKGDRNSLYVFIIGFLLSMVTQVIGMTPSAMFVTLISAGLASDVIGNISILIYYQKGV